MTNELAQFATAHELTVLQAIETHGSNRKAATSLGVDESSIRGLLMRLQLRAAKRGHSPEHDMTKVVPDGFSVKGVSTYYGQDGKPRGQWVKSRADATRVEQIMREISESIAENTPRLRPTVAPDSTQSDLCNLYVMTDCHMGMLAWHKENGGVDWDLSIAETVLSDCFGHMVSSSPKSGTAIVAQLGDWLHSDGMLPVTPTSGHVLDQDSRFSKVVQATVRTLRRLIGFALDRHQQVVVLMAEGNHDPASSIWLRTLFRALYEHEPRVLVIDSEMPYYVHQHGQTMLAFHHGHLSKNDQLPMIFAAQFSQMWGATTKRYCHTGHRHHTEEKEHRGMTVIQHPTLAARDAYASRGGWISERQVTSITYHSKWGQVARTTVTPEMVS